MASFADGFKRPPYAIDEEHEYDDVQGNEKQESADVQSPVCAVDEVASNAEHSQRDDEETVDPETESEVFPDH
jgi:hypothetical protein